MPDPAFHDHVLAGRLLAALWTVRLLAKGGGTPPESGAFPPKAMPTELVGGELKALTGRLLTARGRDADRWKAAVEVFRDVPDLLPKKLSDKNMSEAELKAFADGYDAQRAAHTEKYGRLLEP
ncbi:hypothetical protein [Streptomyces sp. NPDC007070]|uniref:hypothetical protein n=1 Tax=Streptomyces sp. NPDC007070 TaxID=3154312 RepID=UPI0033C01C57